MSHLTKAILWLILALLMVFCCATKPPLSTDTTEVSPLTSSEPSVPSEPLAPETSETDSSETTESSEPSTSMPEESEEPDTQSTPEELLWAKRWEECPVATEIWLQMKSYGWTDAACAGIMGNIMRETGGNTLKYIKSNIYNKNKTHYGLCQWSVKYYPDIQPTSEWIPSVADQIEFLRYTIINQKKLHHNYGFDEEYLKTATDYRKVAVKFCNGYERPSGGSVSRKKNAQIAWEYFVLELNKQVAH